MNVNRKTHSRKHLLFVLLFAVIFCLCAGLCVAVSAESPSPLKQLWISVTECLDGDVMPRSAVLWYQNAKEEYYVFLPGGTKLDELRIWFEGTEDSIEIDGKTYRSGDRIAIDGECDMKAVYAGKKYTLHIMLGSSIGAMYIETESGDLSYIHSDKENKEGGSLLFIRSNGMVDYNGNLDYIKKRGNTSAVMAKKNYGIKLEKGADLMGLGKAKHWVLLGSYRDHSQIRNQIVYDMAKYAGMKYTCDTAPIDLYLNHVYYGTYLLTERIEVNENRVDITDLDLANDLANPLDLDLYPSVGSTSPVGGRYKAIEMENDPEDITGGYIIEYESWKRRYSTELCAYTTTRGKVLLIKEPERVSVNEMEYISSFMQGFEDAIFADDGIDPATGKRYDEFIDFDSLVIKFMLEEICKNEDGSASSQYFVKPSDTESKVAYAGPAWDYDATLGCYATASKAGLLDPESFYLIKVSNSQYWWPELYEKEEFFQGVCNKWDTVYSHALLILLGKEKDSTGTLLSIQEYAENLRQSAEMNFIRWPIPKPSNQGENIAKTGTTYDANIDYLTDFIQKRYDFLEKEW